MPSQQSVPTTVERFFTNRENYFEIFNNTVNTIFNRQYNVLYFYGVGGVGKSRLKRELSKSIKQQKTASIVISDSLNFQEAIFRSPNSALYSIYSDLKKSGIDFPAFEIAYAVHWQKLHPQLKLSQSSLPFIEEGSIVSDFVSVLGDLPLIGLLPKFATVFHKVKKSYSEWWTRKGEEELKVIENLEVFQIEELLPYYFALDLKDYYLANNQKVVFFIDTYEALWSKQEERKNEKFFTKDKWIRTLIANLPNTLWVIFGRERLRWDEIENDNWGDYIEQHNLRELSIEDANKFLVACHIDDVNIREQIAYTSKGLPFYLDLQVDTYNKIISKGIKPTLSDFPKKYADILSRFCLYLEPSEIETLKILSFSRVWKYHLFTTLIKEFQTGYPATSYSELLKFSFINSAPEDENHSIHQILREHLQEAVSLEDKKLIHTFFFTYYNSQIEQTDKVNQQEFVFIEFNSRILNLVDEAIFHKKSYDTTFNYYDWLLKISQKLYGETNSNLIPESLNSALSELDFNNDYFLMISVSSEIARLYSWKKNLTLIEKYINLGLDLCNKIITKIYQNNEANLIKKEPLLLQLKTDLLIQKAELYDEMDKNLEAYDVYQQAFLIGKKINYEPNRWSYATLLLEIGKIPEAESYFYSQLRVAIDTNDEDLLAVTYTKLATIFFLQKLYVESGVYYKKSIDLYLKIRDENHPYYWICKKRYAETLIPLKESVEGKAILIQTLNWHIERYGESYAENGYLLLALAKCELQENNIFGCLNNLMSSVNMLRQKYGDNSKGVIEGVLLFCNVIQKLPEGQLDLQRLGFSKDTSKSLIDTYHASITNLELGFYRDFDKIKMNLGLSSEVLSTFFDVIGYYYDLQNLKTKKDVINNRKIELNRILQAQFEIRIFETTQKVEVVDNTKKNLLEKISQYIGVDKKIPLTIYSLKLPFYDKTEVYEIIFSNKIKKYLFVIEDEIILLDWTNSPIYNIGEKDFFLSSDTIEEYVYFFFDAVKGRHGKFYFPKSKNDIPYRLDLDAKTEIQQTIAERIIPLSIIEHTDEYILLNASCFFKDSLFGCKVRVNRKGIAALENEELLLEALPIAVDPQVD